jgi:peptidoglycan/xylan/chitin deacetylase (PgdA/CDA1 family)
LSAASACAIVAATGLSPSAAVATEAEVSHPPRFILDHQIRQVAHVTVQRPIVALTFDDGPHPTNTPRLLDILRENEAHATFYLIGTQVVRYPDIVRRIVAEGHEVGNHTWRHPALSQLADAAVLREIDRTTEAIWQATGMVPFTMRPPYGAITQRQTRMIHEHRNLPSVMWSVDPQDWRRPGSSVVASRIVSAANSGAIILAHDIHAPTVAAVPAALAGLRERGFQFVTMSEMLGWGNWRRSNGRGGRYTEAEPRGHA